MELFHFRNGKTTYFRFRYRIRITTVLVLACFKMIGFLFVAERQ